MAGDWIKMRTDLQTHPKVVRILSALNADTCPENVRTMSDKFRVIGGLHAVWCLFDAHSIDGRLDGYSPEILDATIGFPGFTRALYSVGWIEIESQALVLPRFEDHNGQSAKRRAQDADRKQAVRKMSASEADKKRTREEKSREEKKKSKSTRAKSGEVTLSVWIHALDGADAIPADDEIFTWAQAIGMPREWITLAWWAFEARYGEGGRLDEKTYTRWRQVFRSAVKEDWLKLWRQGRNGWELTPSGEAQRLEMEAAA